MRSVVAANGLLRLSQTLCLDVVKTPQIRGAN
jgi:hypothetical protein